MHWIVRLAQAPDGVPVALLHRYARALALYREQRFARVEFESRERFVGDGPSRAFTARCGRMASPPPGEAWDGAFRMEHK